MWNINSISCYTKQEDSIKRRNGIFRLLKKKKPAFAHNSLNYAEGNAFSNSWLFRKSVAFAWYFGIFILFFATFALILLVKTYMLSESTENMEDIITSTALSSLLVDEKRYSLTGDVVIKDTDKSYDDMMELVASNLHISQVEGRKNHFTGISSRFNTSKDDCVITKVVFYNVYHSKNKVAVTTFNENANVSSVEEINLANAYTPQNEKVDYTSCYVEVVYPIKMLGIEKMVKKGEYVSVKKRN